MLVREGLCLKEGRAVGLPPALVEGHLRLGRRAHAHRHHVRIARQGDVADVVHRAPHGDVRNDIHLLFLAAGLVDDDCEELKVTDEPGDWLFLLGAQVPKPRRSEWPLGKLALSVVGFGGYDSL